MNTSNLKYKICFFPGLKIEIQTKLELNEAIELIKKNTAQDRKNYRLAFKPPMFQGKIDHNSFEIWKTIRYTNSFLPLIKGYFLEGDEGVLVRINMQLHPGIKIFVGIYVIFGLTIALFHFLNSTSINIKDIGFPFIFPIFGILLQHGAFWSEAIPQSRLLQELFSGF